MITSFDITAALPRGTTVLEASAGTGKTWTIAALTTRLLAQGHAQVGQLLIITFTRAAAAELRSRIHARLTQVSRDLQHTIDDAVEPEQSDELTAFLASHPVEEVGRMIARLRQASRDIDSATITTIHGFCSQALAELGIPTSDDIASETAVDLRAEVAADLYLTTYASQPQPPVLAYNQAAEIARTVTENPTATIHPDDPGDETTQARVDFARTVRTEFHRRKRANGIFTYNDVLTELAGVVDPEHPDQHTQTARQRLRNRWRYVLVDEFQDTDDIQWRILSHVFHTHRDVVLIGDPKQAIYSFRGGDIYTYLDAITHADSAHTLGFNYRSDQALVRGINEVFDGVALGHQDITARPVKSGKPHDTVRLSTPGPRMRVRVVDRDDFTPSESGNVRVGPLRQAIARDVATDVAFLLTEDNRVWDEPTGQWRGVNAGDVAVLCHTNREVELVRHALDEAGIHAVSGAGVSVFATEAATAWFTLLYAIEHHHNPAAVGAVAITPFFGYTATDVATDHDEVIDDVATTLRELHRALAWHGPAGVYEFLQSLGEEGLATRVMRHDGGVRLLTDLAHIGELMHAAHPQASPATLIQWLGEKIDDPPSEETRRVESGAPAVQVLTIHSAKGLQFPFVYLPTLCTQTPKRIQIPVYQNHGQRCVDLSAKRPKHVTEALREEQQGEAMRLLYVAITRAVGQVTMYWAPAQQVQRSAFNRLIHHHGPHLRATTPHDQVIDALTNTWGSHVGAETITSRQPPPLPSQPEAKELQGARRWDGEVDRAWRRTSYTALAASPHGSAAGVEESPVELKETAHDHRMTTPAAFGTTPPVAVGQAPPAASEGGVHLASPMDGLARGAQFGSLVHAILENLNTRAPDRQAEIARLVTHHQPLWGVQVDEPALVQAIEAVVTTPLLPATSASVVDLDPQRMLAELDFELPLDGGQWAQGPPLVKVADMAVVLRTHLEEDDPLASYAATLEQAAYASTPLRGYLTGSIDVVFEHAGRFYVADYKTNWLGPPDQPNTTATYTPPHMRRTMEGSTYPLQALLYTVALHRYLTWRMKDYDVEAHLGGVLYLYVRGMAGPSTPVVDGASTGVFYWQPPPGLVTELSELLNGADGSDGSAPDRRRE